MVGIKLSQRAVSLLINPLRTLVRLRNSVGLGIFVVVYIVYFGIPPSVADASP